MVAQTRVLEWLLVGNFIFFARTHSLGICSACCMLYYTYMEALVYSDNPRAAATSTCLVGCLAIIFGGITSGVPWFIC